HQHREPFAQGKWHQQLPSRRAYPKAKDHRRNIAGLRALHCSKSAPLMSALGPTSVIAVMSSARPLFPQEQTFGGTPRTFVSCQTRTSADYSITFVGERE